MKTYKISEFLESEDSAMDIARLHLGIRQWQVQQGQAKFTKGIMSSQEDLKNLQTNYIEKGGNFFIAKDSNGEVLGFLGVRNDGEGTGTIKRVAVMPKNQGRGIGSSLLKAGMEWSRRNGYRKLSLSTGINETAKPLYEKFGFKVVGRDLENEDYLMEIAL